MDKNDDDLSFEGITTSTLQQDVHCGVFLDENDKSIEFFITIKYKTHNYFHVNSFYYVTQNSMSNFVVVDNINDTIWYFVFHNKRSNTVLFNKQVNIL